MIHLRLHEDSPAHPAAQVYEQIAFAIASRQIRPGARLPSVRQLSMQTGVHSSTIWRAYAELEADGFVQARTGSGVYVCEDQSVPVAVPGLIRRTIQTLLDQGYSPDQIQHEFTQALNHYQSGVTQLWATAQDPGILELLVEELQRHLGITIRAVPLAELLAMTKQSPPQTVITQRYHLAQVCNLLAGSTITVIPIDHYDYQTEITLTEQLAAGSTLGVVSLSARILRIAMVFVHSLRGQTIRILTCQPTQTELLQQILQEAQLILTDLPCYAMIQGQIKVTQHCHPAPQYIANESLARLRQHLAMDTDALG